MRTGEVPKVCSKKALVDSVAQKYRRRRELTWPGWVKVCLPECLLCFNASTSGCDLGDSSKQRLDIFRFRFLSVGGVLCRHRALMHVLAAASALSVRCLVNQGPAETGQGLPQQRLKNILSQSDCSMPRLQRHQPSVEKRYKIPGENAAVAYVKSKLYFKRSTFINIPQGYIHL